MVAARFGFQERETVRIKHSAALEASAQDRLEDAADVELWYVADCYNVCSKWADSAPCRRIAVRLPCTASSSSSIASPSESPTNSQ